MSHTDVLSLRHEVEMLRKMLGESERVREAFVNSSCDGFWDRDLEKDHEYMSPRFWELLGYDYREKKHHPSEWQKLIFPEDLELVKENFKRHVESKGEYPFVQTVRYKHKSGTTVTLRCRGSVVSWSENGEPLRIIGTYTDLTALADKEKKIHEQFLAYERANKELEEYAYITSHDLQAPLRHIVSYIEILKDSLKEKLNEDEVKIMSRIQDGCFKMKELINGLRELSSIAEHKIVVEAVNLNEVMDEVVQKNVAKGKLNTEDVHYDSLPTIEADKQMIKSVFLNLLENSIQFKRKEVPLVIEVKANVKADLWEIAFKDNGIGFDPSKSEIIFQLFKKLYSKDSSPSSGLGLAIIRKVVECHRGKIRAESKPNEGAVFYLYLPRTDFTFGVDVK